LIGFRRCAWLVAGFFSLAIGGADCLAQAVDTGSDEPSSRIGSWRNIPDAARKLPGEIKKTGAWKKVEKVKDKAVDYYEASPNLKSVGDTTIEVGRDAAAGVKEAIQNLALEELPGGDLAQVLLESPDLVKSGLDGWLANKANNAAIAGKFDLADRYLAVVACLHGDCSALHAIQSGNVKPSLDALRPVLRIVQVSRDSLMVGDPDPIKIDVACKSLVTGVMQIQLSGAPSDSFPYQHRMKVGDEGRYSFFARPKEVGTHLVKIACSVDASPDPSPSAATAALAFIVTEKSTIDGRYVGRLEVHSNATLDKPSALIVDLEFTVNGQNVTGGGKALDPVGEAVKVQTKLDGKVDDKGALDASFTQIRTITEPDGTVYGFTVTAPIRGIIEKGRLHADFTAVATRSQHDAPGRTHDLSHAAALMGTYSWKKWYDGGAGVLEADRQADPR
jgi:hypothetical protein